MAYVELSSLASPSEPIVSVAVGTSGQQPTISLTPTKVRPSGNVLEWLRLFATYSSIYLQHHESEAPAMLTYMVNIIDMQPRHGGFAWRTYDESFRCVRALSTALPWNVTNWDLAMHAIHGSIALTRPVESRQWPFRGGQNHPTSGQRALTIGQSFPQQGASPLWRLLRLQPRAVPPSNVPLRARLCKLWPLSRTVL